MDQSTERAPSPPPPPPSELSEPQESPATALRWVILEPGDVLRVNLPASYQTEAHSYALYCGHGRVIHSWSDTGHRFRVRVDPIRVLEKTGCLFERFTEPMDDYCERLMALQPLDSELIVPRARQAVHAATTCHGSSLSLVLWARYGDVVFSMAESLVKELPCLAIRLSQVPDADTRRALEQENLHALVSRLSIHPSHHHSHAPPDPAPQIPPPPPPTSEATVEDEPEQEQHDIAVFMGSVVERIVSEWIRATLAEDYGEFPATGHSLYAIQVPDVGPLRVAELPALLVFDVVSQGFTVMFKSNGSLAQRLAADDMECGICFADLRDAVVSLLQCSHYLCRSCLCQLSYNQCPYCRASIVFYREIGTSVKNAALEIMQLADEATSVTFEQSEQSSGAPE